MSSSTDPYQPVEHKEEITRALLEVMVEEQPDFLMVQTRSPLVTRDMDLLKKLGKNVLVSMTIETDVEDVRKRFSPAAPPIPARIAAVKSLYENGVPTQVAIAPALPFSDRFAQKLKGIVDRVCVDDFTGDGSGGKRSERLNVHEKYEEGEKTLWLKKNVQQLVYEKMCEVFPKEKVVKSPEGFFPPQPHSHL